MTKKAAVASASMRMRHLAAIQPSRQDSRVQQQRRASTNQQQRRPIEPSRQWRATAERRPPYSPLLSARGQLRVTKMAKQRTNE